MSYKMTIRQFTRTASIVDLRTDALSQEVARIRRKAIAGMMKNRAFGRAVFA